MNRQKFSRFFSLGANSLVYRLKISFSLFFLVPVIGFIYFAYHYKILGDIEATYYFLAFLVFSFVGFFILRRIMERMNKIADTMVAEMSKSLGAEDINSGDELEKITVSFKALNDHLSYTGDTLEHRMAEIEALRDLNQLSFAILDRQTLMARSLDRALEVTRAVGGAVFTLEKKNNNSFLVCRSIAREGFLIGEGKKIPLSKHPARHSVETAEAMLISRKDAPEWGEFLTEDIHQIATIPMTDQNGLAGVAVLARMGDAPWQGEVLNFLAPFFNTVITALRIQELMIEEREKTEDLKTVLDIIEMINSGLAENEMILAIADKLNDVIPHHWIGLALVDEERGELRLAHTFRMTSPRVPIGMTFPVNDSLFQTAMRSRGGYSIEDVDKHPNYFEHDIMETLGIKSCYFAGLNFRGKPIGAICLAHAEKGAFKKIHGQMLTAIADAMSIAIGQSWLLTKAREKTGELEVINRVGKALTSSTFNMDHVLAYTIEMISGLINAEAGSLLLLEEDDLVFKVVLGKAKESLKGKRIKFGHGVVGWVAASGEPLMVQDVNDNPHFFPEVDRETGFKSKNLLCVPMIVSGQCIGVIELLNKIQGTFNSEDMRMLKSVASSAAIAIENSRLYSNSVQNAKKERLIRNIFQKYVPKEVSNEILELGERDLIKMGERRLVTLLNVDIRGYSRMSKQAKAEQVVLVLNYFFMKMGTVVLKHKGILDKYLGDGLLAVFGAPLASRNPAFDATLAGIEMVLNLESVSKIAQERCGVPLNLGVSINTGEAIVGNIGFEKKMEYTVIGDVVNDTFRLQELTREIPNSIMISQSTYEKIHPVIQTNSLGLKTLGRNEGQMEVYEVTDKREMSDLEYLMQQTDMYA